MKFSNNKLLKGALEILVLLLAVYYISSNWYQLLLVQGSSMEPTYGNFHLTIIQRKFEQIKHGDVIAFTKDGIDGVIVKRVIAVEGEHVEMVDGVVVVNGEVSDDVLTNCNIKYAGCLEEELVIPSEAFFVMGDNVNNSIDSRYEEIGYVTIENIIGICK